MAFVFPLIFFSVHSVTYYTLPENWACGQGRFSVVGIRWLHNDWHTNHGAAPCWLLDTHMAKLMSLSQFILLFHFPTPWLHLFPYQPFYFPLPRLTYSYSSPKLCHFKWLLGSVTLHFQHLKEREVLIYVYTHLYNHLLYHVKICSSIPTISNILENG